MMSAIIKALLTTGVETADIADEGMGEGGGVREVTVLATAAGRTKGAVEVVLLAHHETEEEDGTSGGVKL